MRKRWIAGALFLAVAGGAFYMHFQAGVKTVNEVRHAITKATGDADMHVDLSLKGIELLQGESGEEQWRLKAAGAWYEQKEGVVQVSKPEITYYLKPSREPLVVKADMGVVDQQQNKARLWGNVVVERQNGFLRSDRLIFNGTDQTLNLLGSVHFDGPEIFGNATNVVWGLSNSTINANEGVAVELRLTQQVEDLAAGVIKDDVQ